jgi:anti-sigma factor RsiW
VTDYGPGSEQNRVEAARLIGEMDDRELSGYLRGLIRDEHAPAVIREAMLAAGRLKEPALMGDIISRVGSSATLATARDALCRYGETAVRALRTALFDNRVEREIRLQLPRTLARIEAQSAVNALQAGLLEEDRAIRFQVIVAIEEMSRRFTDLKLDREIIESAIMSDALLYYRRLAIFAALFGAPEEASNHVGSLLYYALTDSLQRVRERIMWLLAVIYRRKDIRQAWSGLRSEDPLARAHAIELLDNLLTGNIRDHVWPIFSDAQADQRLRTALKFLGTDPLDVGKAMEALLSQQDRWLKAAAIWEIGQRELGEFRGELLKLAVCPDPLLSETATRVVERRAPA